MSMRVFANLAIMATTFELTLAAPVKDKATLAANVTGQHVTEQGSCGARPLD